MSRRLVGILVGIGVLAGCFDSGTLTAAEPPTRLLRVLCYNIHHGEGTDGRVDLERLAGVIRSANPDLVALQEVDDRTQRTGRVDQTALLADLTGLHGRFAKQIDYEGGGYGQAFLSRFPLSEVTIHWLPGEPDRERRIAAAVTVEWDAEALTFVTTHLHHADADFRKQQAEAINAELAQSEDWTILVGDLNATPDSEPISLLTRHWMSATAQTSEQRLTFPAEMPNRQLDYVLYRPAGRMNVLSTQVLDEPVASDHRPLRVEFAY